MNRNRVFALAVVAAMSTVALAPNVVGLVPDDIISPLEIVDRYVPRTAGVEKDMRFFFGPFVIPPGQDINRVTLDIPVHSGFIVAVAPNLVDAATGHTPSNQQMHIHHAHWFRVSDDPSDEYYTANLAWIFGTGEERTQGSLNERSAAEPGGPRYGLWIPEGQPQALIYMLHNKDAVTRTVYVTLDVRFVYGTAEAIEAAEDCPLLQEDEVCSAGDRFHALRGRLWGSTFDVPRQATGDGEYVHPVDIPVSHASRQTNDDLGRYFVAPYDGTAIASAGHLHPNGVMVVVANLGPEGSGCDADLDSDGYPGVSLYYSRKMHEEPGEPLESEEYQMGATQMGWRAPIREGDRIAQFGVYKNDEFASYEAMSYVGIYVDREQPPAPYGDGGCTAESLAAYTVDGSTLDPRETVLNHQWKQGHSHPFCGFGEYPACDRPVPPLQPGMETDTIHIADFLYLPGDQSLSGQLGAPARVAQGTPLTFINDDVGIVVRHTVTSCAWPCNGPYTANYPQPDGDYDSGKLGNLDYIDGGITGDDTSPVYTLDTSEMDPGLYSYYCRIHPWMRGWMEVTPQA